MYHARKEPGKPACISLLAAGCVARSPSNIATCLRCGLEYGDISCIVGL
jgi:hypothetical protein